MSADCPATTERQRVIAAICADLRVDVSFFPPSVKPLAKQRTGARVHKRYDTAAAAHQRLPALGVLGRA